MLQPTLILTSALLCLRRDQNDRPHRDHRHHRHGDDPYGGHHMDVVGDMMPSGYYTGTGPWLLMRAGWLGKVFWPTGKGINVFKDRPRLPFTYREEGDRVRIV